MIQSIKIEALENNVPIIQDASLEKINSIIKENNVKKILEIGTAVGYSSICFCQNESVEEIHTIERNIDMYNKATENIDLMKLNDKIKVLFGDALEVDNKILPNDFDLMFVDAAKAQSKKFIEKYLPNMKVNGIIVVDNILFHGVDKNDPTISKNLKHLVEKIEMFIEWITNDDRFETTIFNGGDGLTISLIKDENSRTK